MDYNLKNLTFIFSIITTALTAGLFYGWVVSVIPGTKKVNDFVYLETMQSINREIFNSGFFVMFFGAVVLLLLSAYLQFKVRLDSAFYLALSATIIYTLGTIGITIIGNVPLNNTLEALDLTSLSSEACYQARRSFESKWNSFNSIRTLAAVISFVLILLSFIKIHSQE